MILLPTLPTASPEDPSKSAALAAPEGVFASILLGETDSGEPASGKGLPDSGKILPDALPPQALALQIFRNRFIPQASKQAAKAENTSETSGDFKAVQGEDKAGQDETKTAPAPAETVLGAVMDLQINLTPAPLAPAPVAPFAEPQGEPIGEGPEHKPAKLLPLVFPGMARAPESAAEPVAETGESKPAVRTPTHAAPTLLAALAKHGEAKAEPGSASTEQAAQPATPAAAAPVIAQEAGRAAKPVRQQARREITLELTKSGKAAVGDQPALRMAGAAGLSSMPTAQPLVADASAPAQNSSSASAPASPSQPVRPHEFAALVDRLVEAREAAQPSTAKLTVTHADFGQVSVRFGQDNGGLTVSLANNDPGFIPAVNAAVAADASANGEQTGPQSDRRDGQQASARIANEGNTSTGERGQGRERGERTRTETTNHAPHFANRDERKALGGIFA